MEEDLVEAEEDATDEEEESDWRKCASWGMMMAMGRVASGVACTQMLETRLQDL